MEKYVKEIPLLVRNSIKVLCDENRQGILIYLLKNGSKSFIEISKDLKIPKNNLSHHIKILMRFALVYNFFNRNEFVDKYSFYKISKLGKKLISTLMNFMKPNLYKEEETPDNIEEAFISAEEPLYQPISSLRTLIYTAGTGIVNEKIGYKHFSEKEQPFEFNTAW